MILKAPWTTEEEYLEWYLGQHPGIDIDRDQCLEALRPILKALAQATVVFAPLVWRQRLSSDKAVCDWWVAHSGLGMLSIDTEKQLQNDVAMYYISDSEGNYIDLPGGIDEFKTLEEAKAVAESYYQEKMTSCLAPASTEEVVP